ncbi:hypothetical protein D3C87_78710 [compost metagenome]
MALIVSKDVSFNISGIALHGVVKNDKHKIRKDFYFKPNMEVFAARMTEKWDIQTIELLMDDLEKLKSFLESQQIADLLSENIAEGDVVIDS